MLLHLYLSFLYVPCIMTGLLEYELAEFSRQAPQSQLNLLLQLHFISFISHSIDLIQMWNWSFIHLA